MRFPAVCYIQRTKIIIIPSEETRKVVFSPFKDELLRFESGSHFLGDWGELRT